MKEFIISNIFGLLAGIANFIFFGSLFYLWGFKDPDGFGGVFGILFTTPLLLGMIIFRILSKCRIWLFVDIPLWTCYAILIIRSAHTQQIAIFQVLFMTIPLSLIVMATMNAKSIFREDTLKIDKEQ